MSDDVDPSVDDPSVDERDDEAAAVEDGAEADQVDGDDAAEDVDKKESAPRKRDWTRLLTVLLPALAVLIGAGAGYLTWLDHAAREARLALEQSVQAASESTIAILSYKPETVDQELKAAADRLAEPFRQQYTQLVSDVVAPGAKQQHITAVATVPSAASVSATGKHAVVLVFVDQTTTIGNDAPTQSTSSVRVTLDKVHGRWLISQFDPV
ncbi:hypothetical protein [Mycobacterium sp.]|uniref:hypothetical protein n=1 Tax=Mycobacterium sp. TaxID=1785 RepID=UPI0025EE84B6|nr:hypothetical protein [Mycobacterium sp.]